MMLAWKSGVDTATDLTLMVLAAPQEWNVYPFLAKFTVARLCVVHSRAPRL